MQCDTGAWRASTEISRKFKGDGTDTMNDKSFEDFSSAHMRARKPR